MPPSPESTTARHASRMWLILVAAAAVVGMILLLDSIRWSSATYDEVTYLRVAAHWWRTSEQTDDHPDGLAAHILEAPAGARILDARPAGPSRADRRPDWPSAGVAATGPRRGALDLAGCTCALCRLEPQAVWPQGNGSGRLALRAQPQPDRPRRTGNDGAAAAGQQHRHALPVLDLPGNRPSTLVLGLRGAGRAGFLVQVYHRTLPSNPSRDLVA